MRSPAPAAGAVRRECPYGQTAVVPPPTAPLSGEIETDALVVGGGYAGLSAALHAAKAGLGVTLLEAGEIGAGGSGRNHGHCVPVYGYLDPAAAHAALGAERGARQVRLLADSGALVFSLIERYGIDGEAFPVGTLHVAHDAASVPRLRAQHAKYAALGKAGDWLDAAATRSATGSDAYVGGWIHREGGHLNPLAYARGLARAALAEGATIHTASPVLSLSREGEGWRARTPAGSVRARTVALATNAYTDALVPGLARSFFRLTAYGLASAPLAAPVRETILPGHHNLGDTHRDVRFFRIDAAGRLVVGGLVEPRRGRNVALTAAMMTKRMRAIFPQLDRLDWEWHWQGPLAINLDRRPHLYAPAPGLFALLGFSGRGVPTATALGSVLAEALAGTPPDELAWPVEPVRPIPGRAALSLAVPPVRGLYNRLRDYAVARG